MRPHIHLTSAFLTLACFTGCLEDPNADPEARPESALTSTGAEPSVDFEPVDPDTALVACYPENTCGPEFTCFYEFDEQCGEPFCHQTGNQCKQNGGAGTFTRNEHVKYCWNAAGDFCVDADHGRDLLYCGC